MAKTTVPRVGGSPAQSIPLGAVTITCYRESHFLGEEGQQSVPVTITGRQLGQVLAWLMKTTDLAARLSAVEDGADKIQRATIVLPTRKEAAA